MGSNSALDIYPSIQPSQNGNNQDWLKRETQLITLTMRGFHFYAPKYTVTFLGNWIDRVLISGVCGGTYFSVATIEKWPLSPLLFLSLWRGWTPPSINLIPSGIAEWSEVNVSDLHEQKNTASPVFGTRSITGVHIT